MGPLVPYGIISSEFDLIIALIIGVLFGAVLEQAGFGSSRKLAGVFYGYDFVVLRVFFTAAVTAMVGLILGNHFGIIDMNLVFINPTFLWSTLVGGVIMGFGFVIGGFCPGTSLAGAATGKIDAMFFLGGILLGILLFAESYPLFENLHNASALGPIKIYDTLGISQGLFAFLLIVMAIAAFAITQRIENKINGIQQVKQSVLKGNGIAAAVLVLLGVVVLFIPAERNNKGSIPAAEEISALLNDNSRFIDTDELAFKLMHKEFAPVLADIRTAEEYNYFSLPGAVHIPLDEITAPRWRAFFNDKEEVILYSNAGVLTEDAYVLLYQSGIKNIRILEGGLNTFFEQIFAADNAALTPTSPAYKPLMDKYQFRIKAAKFFQGIENSAKPSVVAPVKPKIIAVEGGC
ncbi:MAG: hypothetical protein EOL88_00455 [Bacteroidia bacterium]|nr:YeeE/YedE family protein [Bacteroidales bacterium]NCD40540.1 hypothetical protein [Bacteroidia bacterium]MDD2321993.1 YeeE/YedE thiosulfate transporter family protein [Bacteroidales bacterium]MDD3010050.1 YeeE/YedE thiosulfate transporter family protein [Bacteroidales bacterium]MDD3960841.1 YeeE/YedE thiosulfate transporter family protein [Bacteroidales bacterium]